MILVACVDNQGAMLFAGRRQSRDRTVQQRILQDAHGSKLWMNHYSAKLFEEKASNLSVDEDFLDKAADGEFCFVENVGVRGVSQRVTRIILYRWNRKYPGDFYFDEPLDEPKWKLVEIEEFPGYSHEKITREVYER